MSANNDLLARIANALERIAPPETSSCDWLSRAAYVWDDEGGRPVMRFHSTKLDLLRGIDAQKAVVTNNIARLGQGHAAHDMLLWGSRGMGKSALVRAAIMAAQSDNPASIALVQVVPDALSSLSPLFATLSTIDRRFLVFIDDLGFEDGDSSGPRALRSWLEGGVEARPANVRLAVTSNRRAIVARHLSEQDDPINLRDVIDDRLALADRFGLSIGFHNCSQDDYLNIIAGYAAAHGLVWQEDEALEWSKRRGARSGRVAWQFVTELAGRAGTAL
jgi:uncharacterized protein